MQRIVTRDVDEENRETIKKAVEEASKKTEETIKKFLEEAGSGGSTGSKISQIIKNANKGTITHTELSQSELEKIEEIKKKERMEFDKEKEKLHKELEESEVLCPTCTGTKHDHEHKHILKKTDKGILKCTGESCGTEYILMASNPDYECKSCGAPHKKPQNEIPDDKCPFCSGTEFFKKDWSNINTKSKKK